MISRVRAPRGPGKGPTKQEWVDAIVETYRDISLLIAVDDVSLEFQMMFLTIRNRCEALMERAGIIR